MKNLDFTHTLTQLNENCSTPTCWFKSDLFMENEIQQPQEADHREMDVEEIGRAHV